MNFEKYYWPWFFNLLPAKFVYFCAMRVWLEATSGKYGTDPITLSVDNAVKRFARIHALPGHGSDEHYDSNRSR